MQDFLACLPCWIHAPPPSRVSSLFCVSYSLSLHQQQQQRVTEQRIVLPPEQAHTQEYISQTSRPRWAAFRLPCRLAQPGRGQRRHHHHQHHFEFLHRPLRPRVHSQQGHPAAAATLIRTFIVPRAAVQPWAVIRAVVAVVPCRHWTCPPCLAYHWTAILHLLQHQQQREEDHLLSCQCTKSKRTMMTL